jgi:hypothetical protein
VLLPDDFESVGKHIENDRYKRLFFVPSSIIGDRVLIAYIFMNNHSGTFHCFKKIMETFVGENF